MEEGTQVKGGPETNQVDLQNQSGSQAGPRPSLGPSKGQNQESKAQIPSSRQPEGSSPGQIQRETYYKGLLPCGRKVELRNETFSLWTREGIEIQLGFQDVEMMRNMIDLWSNDRGR